MGPPSPRLQALIATSSVAMKRAHAPGAARLDLDIYKEATRLLIDAGELTQGVLDAAFEARGFDDRGPLEDACVNLMHAAARLFYKAFYASFQIGAFKMASDALGPADVTERARVSAAEGAYVALLRRLLLATCGSAGATR